MSLGWLLRRHITCRCVLGVTTVLENNLTTCGVWFRLVGDSLRAILSHPATPCTHTHMHTHTHTCTHAHTHARTCTLAHYMHTHMHAHTHTCTHMHTYILNGKPCYTFSYQLPCGSFNYVLLFISFGLTQHMHRAVVLLLYF